MKYRKRHWESWINNPRAREFTKRMLRRSLHGFNKKNAAIDEDDSFVATTQDINLGEWQDQFPEQED